MKKGAAKTGLDCTWQSPRMKSGMGVGSRLERHVLLFELQSMGIDFEAIWEIILFVWLFKFFETGSHLTQAVHKLTTS